jgi:hypothetical protein
MDPIEKAKRGTEQFVAQLARVQPVMLDEPQAFKRACIRLGYETAIAIITAKEVSAKDLDAKTPAGGVWTHPFPHQTPTETNA